MALPSSPFLSRLRTDFLPSTAEKLEIHQLISTRQARIQVIADEIARLRAEQDELQSFIDDHLKLVSPIRQVPADVLREIFHCCIPGHELPTPSALDAPLLFTAVCRLWRQVAVATPRLWNRVHIALPSPTNRYSFITPKFRSFMHFWGEGVQTWLQRSGSMPLLLSISSRDPDHLDIEGCTELDTLHGNVAQQLLPFASRWKSLSLDVSDGVREILTMTTVELSSLEELKSRRWDPYSGQESPVELSLKTVLQSAPSLRKLYMNGPPLHLPIRWNCLTELVIWHDWRGWGQSRGVTLSQAFQVLTFSCSSLRHCTLSISVQSLESDDTLDTFPPIVLPNLHTLNIYIDWCYLASLQRALDSVHAPRLADFYFSFQQHLDEHLNLLALFRFIERSGCTIRSLVLDLPLVHLTESLIDLLTSMPSLRQFRLLTPRYHGEVAVEWFLGLIHSLKPSPSNTNVLCPNIESFMFTACSYSCAAPLLALAEARSADSSAAQKLKRLQVGFERFAIEDAEIPLRLEALQKGGMLVWWTMSPDSPRHPHQPDLDEYVHSAERWWPSSRRNSVRFTGSNFLDLEM
ncbi:hypothetical protein VNI00_008554 [Paramarasmius palmivorus]|uniref:F-box domain-containing protein n=1 Tax=Paramarasmius palmivorus TaxID=297713 RepID=A0AAW0CXY9_9AGAR